MFEAKENFRNKKAKDDVRGKACKSSCRCEQTTTDIEMANLYDKIRFFKFNYVCTQSAFDDLEHFPLTRRDGSYKALDFTSRLFILLCNFFYHLAKLFFAYISNCQMKRKRLENDVKMGAS